MTFCHRALQIQRYEYFGHFDIVKYVDLCNLTFHAINIGVDVSLFKFALFAFSNFEFVPYQCTLSNWMNKYRLSNKKHRLDKCV
jgi:hypothetical protein